MKQYHFKVAYAEKLDPSLILELFCHIHQETVPFLWCWTCGVEVCYSCTTHEHQYHAYGDLMIKLSKQRDVIVEEVKELRDITLPKWENALQITQETIATYQKSFKNIDEEPNQSMLEIRRLKLDNLQDQEKELTEGLRMMKEEVQRYENKLIHIDPNFLLKYKPGSIQSSTKKHVLLCPFEVASLSFPCKGYDPCVACDKDGQVWVMADGIQLIEKNGTIRRTTPCIASDFCFLSNGDVIFIDKHINAIAAMSELGEKKTLIATKWAPYGLCSLKNDDIVVTFPTNHKIIRYSKMGELRWTYDGIDFNYPYKVASSKVNKDIYVIDDDTIIAIGDDGRFRCEYKRLVASDVCADHMGHILVASHCSHTIDILDQECNFIYRLYVSNTFAPWHIAVDRGGCVWCGTHYGTVNVFKFLL